MKRRLILISISCILLSSLLCGCSMLDGIDYDWKDFLKDLTGVVVDVVKSELDGEEEDYTIVSYTEVDEEAEKISNQIYEAIKTKDSKKLKSLFSTYMAQKHDLDKEIKVFLKKIKGKVISVEEISGYNSGRETDAVKGDVYNDYIGDIINLKTDKGYSYCVSIIGIYNCVGAEEKEGVRYIYLNCSDKLDYDDCLAEIGE